MRMPDSEDSTLISEDYRNMVNEEQNQYNLHLLSEKHTKLFFQLSSFERTDSVYIYQSSSDSIISYPLTDLPMMAALSPYAYGGSFEMYDYHFGFRIPHIKFARNQMIFASVGKENPFVTGGLSPLYWTKIDTLQLPNILKVEGYYVPIKDLEPSTTYFARSDSYEFYAQDQFHNNMIRARNVAVKDCKNESWIWNTYYWEGESPHLVTLSTNDSKYISQQWTGQLFKGKPDVIFGFQEESFDCPRIHFIDSKTPPIRIACDNRH